MVRNCLLSPLLQYHLFRLVPKKDDFVFDSPSKIGHALFHCTRDYKKWKFHQYEATMEGASAAKTVRASSLVVSCLSTVWYRRNILSLQLSRRLDDHHLPITI
jgi:hypothetical protein